MIDNYRFRTDAEEGRWCEFLDSMIRAGHEDAVERADEVLRAYRMRDGRLRVGLSTVMAELSRIVDAYDKDLGNPAEAGRELASAIRWVLEA